MTMAPSADEGASRLRLPWELVRDANLRSHLRPADMVGGGCPARFHQPSRGLCPQPGQLKLSRAHTPPRDLIKMQILIHGSGTEPEPAFLASSQAVLLMHRSHLEEQGSQHKHTFRHKGVKGRGLSSQSKFPESSGLP